MISPAYNRRRRQGAVRSSVFLLAAVAAALLPGSTIAQSTGCPGGKPLTLEVLTKYIASKPEEDRAVRRIESCTIDFPLDAQAFDKLSTAGASEIEMNALLRLPGPQVTLEQARTEVMELQRRMEQSGASVLAERDQALHRLDTDYLAQRQQASHTDPKGQFEPTVDYNKRLQQNQNTLAAMDRKHDADRNQLTAAFAKKADDRQRPYKLRIAGLQSSNYPDFRPIVYSSYNPDTRQLKAVVDGDPYSFDQVPPPTAETLSKNWPKVRLFQPYTDDETHRRFLVLAAIPNPVPGYSAKARQTGLLQTHLSIARQDMNQHLYGSAAAEFQIVLQLAPDNTEARDGLTRATAFKKKQIEFINNLPLHGAWLDISSQLIWTSSDTEHTVNWKAANEYCQSLKTAGVTGWRLATVSELRGIYDPSNLRNTKTNLMGERNYYYIKSAIMLHSPLIWTGPQRDDRTAIWFSFSDAASADDSQTSKMGLRALCTHKYDPATDGLDTP